MIENATVPLWAVLIGSAVSLVVALLASWQAMAATKAQAEAAREDHEIEQTKVDAQAYTQAREIYQSTIDVVLEGQRRLQQEVTDLRAEVRDARRVNDELEAKVAVLHTQLSAARGQATRLAARIRTLEDLLRRADVPFPADDSEEQPHGSPGT